ncbi:MAG: hypothetical protein JWM88_2740 [Verrucomicrobia bacterium]|nr:hypothetical protein [Verrucomicrobiota bacterium]
MTRVGQAAHGGCYVERLVAEWALYALEVRAGLEVLTERLTR